MTDYSTMTTKQLKSLLAEKKKEYKEIRNTDYVEKAHGLITKMFSTFKVGGNWIKRTQSTAKQTCEAVSPFGRVRHLYGYLSPFNHVNAAMDRQGPNSVIQGASSDLGFQAAYILDKLIWKYFGNTTSWLHANAVHDSGEHEVHYIELPILIYFIEHSMVSQVQKRAKDVFDWEMLVDLEIEFELFSSLAQSTKWEWIWDELPAMVITELDWQEKELGYKKDLSRWDDFMHNLNIIKKLRTKELSALNKTKGVEYKMLFNSKTAEKVVLFSDS